jgi:hypothetical protein
MGDVCNALIPYQLGVSIMLNTKQLNSKIAGIRRSTDAMRNNIHEILCNAAGHAYQYGDVTFFTRLIDATSGVNQKRIQRWIRDNGFATWNKEKSSYQLNKSAVKDADFEDGHAVAMYLFTEVAAWHVEPPKADQDEKPFDVKVWAAQQFKKHPDDLEAMIAALQAHRTELRVAA